MMYAKLKSILSPGVEVDDDQSLIEEPSFPETPSANADIRQFVLADGWYKGSVVSVIHGWITG